MVLVSYSHRLIVDYSFIKWVSESGKKPELIKKLLRININSKEHPRENIIILEQDFDSLCKDNVIKDKDTIRGCVLPFNLKERLDGVLEGEIDFSTLSLEMQRLVLGVFLTKENPFQVILITTKELKQKYNTDYSSFLDKIKKLDIKDEDEGMVILNDLFRKYCAEHETCNL